MPVNDNKRRQTAGAYQKIVLSLKQRKKGATVADVCAATALPLSTVRELLPRAADEYSSHLQVTQSGEILYTFPNDFKSRYRGAGAVIRKVSRFLSAAIKATAVFLFKFWIVLMLVGYFVLFLILALASVVLSVAVQSKSSNRGSRSYGFNLFGIIWRIWFIREMTRPRYRHYDYDPAAQKKKQSRPMHKAVFSFIFGETDPNGDWEERKERAIIGYIQANRGVICLAEYMVFTGEGSREAEESILSFCTRFGGSPEITEEGTIVYRFDELLLRADSKNFAELSPPVRRLKIFSENSKSMNAWFIVINAVNLIFGSYFLYHSLFTGLLVSDIQSQAASYLYAFTHILLELFTANPPAVIMTILGIVPFAFSLFFWIIPSVRKFMETKENEDTKLSNFKRLGFGRIWSSPKNVKTEQLLTLADECRPKNLTGAGDKVIKTLGAIWNPDIEIDSKGETLYSFPGLENEKRALEQYRLTINPDHSKLGEKVFDTTE